MPVYFHRFERDIQVRGYLLGRQTLLERPDDLHLPVRKIVDIGIYLILVEQLIGKYVLYFLTDIDMIIADFCNSLEHLLSGGILCDIALCAKPEHLLGIGGLRMHGNTDDL